MNDRLGELSHEMAEDIRKTMHREIGDPFGEADDGPRIIRFEPPYGAHCLISQRPRHEPPSRYVHEVRSDNPAWLRTMEAHCKQ